MPPTTGRAPAIAAGVWGRVGPQIASDARTQDGGEDASQHCLPPVRPLASQQRAARVEIVHGVQGRPGGRRADGAAATDAAADRPPPGLVGSSKTSATRYRLHRGESRIRRLQRAVPLAADFARTERTRGGFRVRQALVTLTYRPGAVWDARQVSGLLECYRTWLARRGHKLTGVWVLEQTKAGVPHYHLILWLPRGVTPPKPDKQGWWPHGSTRVEWARNATGYLVKYASKATTATDFPKGARLFGVRGLGECRTAYRIARQPFWLRQRCGRDVLCRRAQGGGWIDSETGELHRSPWVMVARCAQWRWVEFLNVDELGQRAEDDVAHLARMQPQPVVACGA